MFGLSELKQTRFYQEIEEEIGSRERQEERETIAINMLKEKLSLRVISATTGLTLEQIKSLKAQIAPAKSSNTTSCKIQN